MKENASRHTSIRTVAFITAGDPCRDLLAYDLDLVLGISPKDPLILAWRGEIGERKCRTCGAVRRGGKTPLSPGDMLDIIGGSGARTVQVNYRSGVYGEELVDLLKKVRSADVEICLSLQSFGGDDPVLRKAARWADAVAVHTPSALGRAAEMGVDLHRVALVPQRRPSLLGPESVRARDDLGLREDGFVVALAGGNDTADFFGPARHALGDGTVGLKLRETECQETVSRTVRVDGNTAPLVDRIFRMDPRLREEVLASDLLLLDGDGEGWWRECLTACFAALGKPVVVQGGAPHRLGESGIVFPVSGREDLVSTLRLLIDNPYLRSKIEMLAAAASEPVTSVSVGYRRLHEMMAYNCGAYIRTSAPGSILPASLAADGEPGWCDVEAAVEGLSRGSVLEIGVRNAVSSIDLGTDTAVGPDSPRTRLLQTAFPELRLIPCGGDPFGRLSDVEEQHGKLATRFDTILVNDVVQWASRDDALEMIREWSERAGLVIIVMTPDGSAGMRGRAGRSVFEKWHPSMRALLDLIEDLVSVRDGVTYAVGSGGDGHVLMALVGEADAVRERVGGCRAVEFHMAGDEALKDIALDAVPPFPGERGEGLTVSWRSVVFGPSGMDNAGRNAIYGLADQGIQVKVDPIINREDINDH